MYMFPVSFGAGGRAVNCEVLLTMMGFTGKDDPLREAREVLQPTLMRRCCQLTKHLILEAPGDREARKGRARVMRRALRSSYGCRCEQRARLCGGWAQRRSQR